jgi:hypothetical protein
VVAGIDFPSPSRGSVGALDRVCDHGYEMSFAGYVYEVYEWLLISLIVGVFSDVCESM